MAGGGGEPDFYYFYGGFAELEISALSGEVSSSSMAFSRLVAVTEGTTYTVPTFQDKPVLLRRLSDTNLWNKNWNSTAKISYPSIPRSTLDSILNQMIHTNVHNADVDLTLRINSNSADDFFTCGGEYGSPVEVSTTVEDGIFHANNDAAFQHPAYWTGDPHFRIGVYDFTIHW